MAYNKLRWYDHVVERPDTYRETTNADGSKTFSPAPLEIIQMGTPQSAKNMNRPEEALQAWSAAVDQLVTLVDALEMLQADETARLDTVDAKMLKDLGDRITNLGTAQENALAAAKNDLNKKINDNDTAQTNALTTAKADLNKKINDNDTAQTNALTTAKADLNKKIDDNDTAQTNALTTAKANLNKKISDRTADEYRRAAGTLTAAGWQGEGPYTQEVAVSWMKETDMPHVAAVPSGDRDTAILQMREWGCVSTGAAKAGKILFTCLEYKPETDISIQIEVNR